jgi:hypothetical protein
VTFTGTAVITKSLDRLCLSYYHEAAFGSNFDMGNENFKVQQRNEIKVQKKGRNWVRDEVT